MTEACIYVLDIGVPLELVLIPAGEFLMGSPESEPSRYDDEGPQHLVQIARPFYLGKYQVTQAQWRAVMGDNPSYFRGDNLPVENVSWEDCRRFCDTVGQRTGRQVRFPSEAEWECACRAGTSTPSFFGETISTDQANYNGTRPYGEGLTGEDRQKTTPVGMFPPNAFGLYDMHGNVWEWCEDVWHDDYADAPNDGSAWTTGGQGGGRVLRGGSWLSYVPNVRSACRIRGGADGRYDNDGFRLAAEVF
jgi:formylglycine-generating enzyme required for sulfatase activity